MVLVSFVKLGARRHDVLMMMTTIPSPQLMRTDTKRAKNKERSERISSSVFNRTNNNVDDEIQTSSRLTFAQKGGKNVRWKEGYKQTQKKNKLD